MALVRLPGLIDPHVHLRDPGATHKEDFTTGTQAALAGGFTAVLDMPNNPGGPVLSPEALARKAEAANGRLACDVGLYYGASITNIPTFPQISEVVFGLKLYLDHTTGDLKIEDLAAIRDIMAAWPRNKPLCVHAEDRTLAMILGLVPFVGRSVHFCHVSERIEIEMIRDAKERGLPVTCEVAPHHLFLTEADMPRLKGFGMMKPPLKKQQDVDALWANLDVVDMIATDHAPHTREEKAGPNPPFGVPGLETSLPLMLTAVNQGRLGLERLAQLMHAAPFRLFRLPQQPDTYIEIDPTRKWRISENSLLTKCAWTPFEGMEVTGAVVNVTLRGRQVVRNGQVFVEPGWGRIIQPLA